MEDRRQSRRKFLGTVGKTAAAAVGVSVLGARTAHAETGTAGPPRESGPDAVTYRCCVSTCRSCAAPNIAYYCTPNSSGCASYCTSCQSSKGTCYSFTSGC